MKIFLLNPPFPLFPGETKFVSPPLGLAYIAASLERKSHEVCILDAVVEGYSTETKQNKHNVIYGLTSQDILKRIKEFNPEIIGIACVFSTLHDIVLNLCSVIKRSFPAIKIILGGTHATVLAQTLVSEPCVDFVIRGEGEVAMVELSEYLSGSRSIESVSGLTWKKNDQIEFNPQNFCQDIDDLPFPARHLLNMEAYKKVGILQGATRPGIAATTVITSRGCPASCVFCSIHSVWGKKFRPHSAKYVLKELQILKEKFAITHVVFEDDNITYDKKRAQEIFRGMIENKMKLTWSAPNGIAVWCLDTDLLRLIRDSGCTVLFLALESGVQDTLDNIIHKPLNLKKALDVVRECRRLRMTTQAFFVIGLPGETKETMGRSMAFAEQLGVDRISIAIATPFPGTELYEICQKNGYLSPNFDISELMTRRGQIFAPDFVPIDVEGLASRTYLRFAIFHPWATLRRLAERFRIDPLQTVHFIFKRLIGVR